MSTIQFKMGLSNILHSLHQITCTFFLKRFIDLSKSNKFKRQLNGNYSSALPLPDGHPRINEYNTTCTKVKKKKTYNIYNTDKYQLTWCFQVFLKIAVNFSDIY